jgi:hypothetical protein
MTAVLQIVPSIFVVIPGQAASFKIYNSSIFLVDTSDLKYILSWQIVFSIKGVLLTMVQHFPIANSTADTTTTGAFLPAQVVPYSSQCNTRPSDQSQ